MPEQREPAIIADVGEVEDLGWADGLVEEVELS